MQIKTILNRVHPIKGFVYEKDQRVGQEIEVTVRPRKGTKAICSGCARERPTYDTGSPRRFMFVPPWGLAVFLSRWARRLSWREVSNIFEISWTTVVYQIDKDCRRLLWIGPNRTTETLRGFFKFLGKKRTLKVKFVCSDLWKPYLKVIRTKAGHAVHILDRYHLVARINKALDKIRAGEARRLSQDGYEPVLTPIAGGVS